jgi:hypothetical protein
MSSTCSNALSEYSEKSVGTRILVGISILRISFSPLSAHPLSTLIIAAVSVFGRIARLHDSGSSVRDPQLPPEILIVSENISVEAFRKYIVTVDGTYD